MRRISGVAPAAATGVELFFDLKDEGRAADNPPGDLLSTAITVGGDTQRYFRFRTPDGARRLLRREG